MEQVLRIKVKFGLLLKKKQKQTNKKNNSEFHLGKNILSDVERRHLLKAFHRVAISNKQ